jgi:hypothetical protein
VGQRVTLVTMPPTFDDHLAHVMAEALAGHAPGTSLGDAPRTVLFANGARGRCAVFAQPESPVVQLSLELAGGVFEAVPVQDDWASFGDSPERAVVQGAHDWLAHNGGALGAALGGGQQGAKTALHAIPFSLCAGAPQVRATAAVDDLGRAITETCPAQRVLDSGTLPALSPSRAHLLTCFAATTGGGAPTLEVKIDGRDWPAAHAAIEPLLRAVRLGPGGGYASFRQLAVLVPAAGARAVVPSVDAFGRSLRGLAIADPHLQVFGAGAHRWSPALPLDGRLLAGIESTGVHLPPAYRELVTRLWASGPGPGYGLLPPHAQEHLAVARGPFTATSAWRPPPGEDADGPVRGTLPLAHLGCGYVAMLVVEGPAYGQVWADLRGAGEGIVPWYPSVVEFLFDWLDTAVTGRLPAMPLRAGLCAFPNAISNYLRGLEEKKGKVDARAELSALPDGAIQTRSDGTDRLFNANDAIDLCPLCEGLRQNLGMRREIFVPGVPPKALRRAP